MYRRIRHQLESVLCRHRDWDQRLRCWERSWREIERFLEHGEKRKSSGCR